MYAIARNQVGEIHSGGGGRYWKGLHSRVPTPAHSPHSGTRVGPISPLPLLVRDQWGCAGAPPTRAVTVPQAISTEASTELVDRMDVCTWTSGRTKVRGLEKRSVRGSKNPFTLMFPSRDRCEPFAPVGLCPSGSLGSSGAWPPRRRASTTGRWPSFAASCKAVSPQRLGVQ